MRLSNPRLYILIVALTLICNSALCQEIEEIKFDKTLQFTRRIHDPLLLLKTIARGRTSEKEKFDAIFNWVVQNIDYDYSTYYSSNGSYPISVKKLLKRKRGVCINYAFLMDTLCKLSGLKSSIITGYAKDELFDVNDSIYADNHAWNAVKLDGLWYLYDVTFASGEVYYRYTKFTQIINYLIRHAALKRKTIVIKPKIRFFFAHDCDDGGADQKEPIRKDVYVVRNKLFLKVLLMFRPHYVRDYKKGFNAGYYLTRPDLFAIDHFPDDPDWSLLNEQTMRDFETDSAFYHFTRDTLIHQQRYGVVCPDCDADIAHNQLNRNYHMRKKSISFNPRNRFVTSTCEYCIAKIKYKEAKVAEDSLTKMTLIDTSRAYIKYARESLKQGGLGARNNFMLQKEKNLKKEYLLLDENRDLYEFLKNLQNKSENQTRKVSGLQEVIQEYAKKTYRRGLRIQKGRQVIKTKDVKKRVPATIELLKEKQQYLQQEMDSLNQRLEDQKLNFSNLLPSLSDSIWKFVNAHDAMLTPLMASADLRMSLMDNYKKKVVAMRIKVQIARIQLDEGLDTSIYGPSLRAYLLAAELLKTLDKRNSVSEDLFKVIEQLVAFSELPQKAISDYSTMSGDRNQNDFCWLRGKNAIYLKSMFMGFNELKKKQWAISTQLRRENKIETVRAQTVVAELIRRKKREMRIIIGRRKALFKFAVRVKKYRRHYLTKLGREQKKQKKREKRSR